MTLPAARTDAARQLPKPLAVALIVVGVLLALWLPGTSASAHDVLESTSPASQSTVPSVPDQVTLTMDGVPAAIGSKIEIKDGSGMDWAQGQVAVLDRVATQRIKAGAPAGRYTVNWRLVSADGHPIEGTFSFTASAAGDGSNASQATTPGPVANPAPQANTTAEASEATLAPASDGSGFPWLIAGIVLVALLLLAALVVVVRRNLNQAKD